MAAKIPKIELSKEEASRMVRRLREWRDEAVSHRTDWDDLHDTYWRLYRAEPKSKTKDFPWPGASNLFIPLAQSTINSIQSQIYDAIAANDPMIDVQAVEGPDVADSFALADYYDGFLLRQVIPFRELFNDAVLNACVDGSTAWKPLWDRSLKVCRQTYDEPVVRKQKHSVSLLGVESEIEDEIITGYESTERAYVRRIDRPALDVVDTGRLFWLPDTGASLQWPACRSYFERCWLTYDDLLDRRRGAGWRFDEDEIKAQLGEREISERERTEREREGVSETVMTEVLEVDEFYFRWALPSRLQIRYDPENVFDVEQDKEEGWAEKENAEDGYPEEVIAWWAPSLADNAESNYGLLKIVPLERIYPDGKRPHKLQFYDRIPNSPIGQGLAGALRSLNEWMNASANQLVDYGTLRNIPFFLYSPVSSGLMNDMAGIRPGQGIPTMDPRGVTFPRLVGDNSFWVNSMNIAQGWGEKISKVTDYTMGRAPNVPNAPRTARGQAMMIQASSVSFNRLVGLMVEPLLEVLRSLHALHSKWMRADTKFAKYNAARQTYENRFISARTFRNEAQFRMVVNPNRSNQVQQSMQIMQNLAPILQAVNPAGLRLMWKEILQLTGSHFSREFDALWPEQPPQMMMGPGQMQPGIPPAGMNPMMGAESEPMSGDEGITVGGVQ